MHQYQGREHDHDDGFFFVVLGKLLHVRENDVHEHTSRRLPGRGSLLPRTVLLRELTSGRTIPAFSTISMTVRSVARVRGTTVASEAAKPLPVLFW